MRRETERSCSSIWHSLCTAAILHWEFLSLERSSTSSASAERTEHLESGPRKSLDTKPWVPRGAQKGPLPNIHHSYDNLHPRNLPKCRGQGNGDDAAELVKECLFPSCFYYHFHQVMQQRRSSLPGEQEEERKASGERERERERKKGKIRFGHQWPVPNVSGEDGNVY